MAKDMKRAIDNLDKTTGRDVAMEDIRLQLHQNHSALLDPSSYESRPVINEDGVNLFDFVERFIRRYEAKYANPGNFCMMCWGIVFKKRLEGVKSFNIIKSLKVPLFFSLKDVVGESEDTNEHKKQSFSTLLSF